MSITSTIVFLKPELLSSLSTDPSQLDRLFFESGQVEQPEVVVLDLDKAWHGLFYLLTGLAEEDEAAGPLGFLLVGGLPVECSLDYGIRTFKPQEVQEIHSALVTTSIESLTQRFDPTAMMEQGIYPEIWDVDPEEDDVLAWLLEYYRALSRQISAATDRGMSMLVGML